MALPVSAEPVQSKNKSTELKYVASTGITLN